MYNTNFLTQLFLPNVVIQISVAQTSNDFDCTQVSQSAKIYPFWPEEQDGESRFYTAALSSCPHAAKRNRESTYNFTITFR
jgi:hypothetical protein